MTELLKEQGWERLTGAALTKAQSLTVHSNDPYVWAKKYGRKTVFLRLTGMCRLYVIDDNGVVHNDRCVPMNALDNAARDLIDRAMKWGKYDVAI
jgi:hypothetical protein